MFLPSGTMCNQVAIATHCRPGDEILAHEDAHIQSSEGGAPGAIAGVMITRPERRARQFTAETVEEAIRPVSRYSPPQRLVEVEQTANQRRRRVLECGTARGGTRPRTSTAWRCTWTAPG